MTHHDTSPEEPASAPTTSPSESGTFCPECGKLKHHPEAEDQTITAGLEVNVEWFNPTEEDMLSANRPDLFIFVNHCERCGYTMQLLTGPVLPAGDSPGPRNLTEDRELFDSLEEYKEWLTTEFAPLTADWTEEPIPIDTDELLTKLSDS